MRGEDYISEARAEAKNLWDSVRKLKSMQAEWNALDYGNTLADGTGANEGYTSGEVGAVVFATADAIEATLASGHATNLASLL